MSSAKQRSNKGGGSSPSEKGAHSSLLDDVAKKHPPQQQQSQAHAKGAKGSASAAGAGKPSSLLSLGKVFNGLFYLALLAVAGLSGWGAHRLWEEVSHLGQRQEGFARQREELARTLDGVERKVIGGGGEKSSCFKGFLWRGGVVRARAALAARGLRGRRRRAGLRGGGRKLDGNLQLLRMVSWLEMRGAEDADDVASQWEAAWLKIPGGGRGWECEFAAVKIITRDPLSPHARPETFIPASFFRAELSA